MRTVTPATSFADGDGAMFVLRCRSTPHAPPGSREVMPRNVRASVRVWTKSALGTTVDDDDRDRGGGYNNVWVQEKYIGVYPRRTYQRRSFLDANDSGPQGYLPTSWPVFRSKQSGIGTDQSLFKTIIIIII